MNHALTQEVRQLLVPLLVRPDTAPSLPLVPGHLHIALGTSDGRRVRPVPVEDLAAWGEPFAELLGRSAWNLRARSDDRLLEPLDALEGLWQVNAADGVAASRMLCLADILWPMPAEGVVVACPRPDQLLVVPLDGVAAVPALQALLRIAAEASHASDTLSDQLFWSLDGQDWEVLPVRHRTDGVDLDPSGRFLAALERMIAVDLVPEPAEA